MMATTSSVRLTERERVVLQLAANGYLQKETADELDIRITTVKAHLESARMKLVANNTTHAVVIAMRLGIVR